LDIILGKADLSETLEIPFDVILLLQGGCGLFVLQIKIDGRADQERISNEEED